MFPWIDATGHWIVQAGAVVAATGIIWKAIISPSRAWRRNRLEQRWRLDRGLETIEKLASEVMRNGGASLRDAVDRIERRQLLGDLRHRALIQDYHHGIVETDAEGSLTWTNRTMQRMSGRSLSETVGDGWVQVIAPDDRDRVYREWQDVIEQERDYDMDFHIISASGDTIPVHSRGYCIKLPDGEVLGWMATVAPVGEGT